jgi:putative phosphoesterase
LQIGIISDTHGSLPAQVHLIFAGVHQIVHAGDIGSMRIIDELATIAPTIAVCGNCDNPRDYPFNHWTRITLSGTDILLVHIPADATAALGDVLPSAAQKPHIIIHGHTHLPRQQRLDGILWLCPGSPTRPRNGSAPSVMLLDAKDGIVRNVETIALV